LKLLLSIAVQLPSAEHDCRVLVLKVCIRALTSSAGLRLAKRTSVNPTLKKTGNGNSILCSLKNVFNFDFKDLRVLLSISISVFSKSDIASVAMQFAWKCCRCQRVHRIVRLDICRPPTAWQASRSVLLPCGSTIIRKNRCFVGRLK